MIDIDCFVENTHSRIKLLRYLTILAMLCFVAFIQLSNASNLSATQLTHSYNGDNIPLNVEYLPAVGNTLNTNEIFNIDTGFKHLETKILPFSTPTPAWIRFSVENTHHQDLTYTLDLGSHFINTAHLFYYEQGLLKKHTAGLNYQNTRQVLQNRNINFTINIPAQQQETYLLYIDSYFYNRIFPSLLTNQGTYESQSSEQALSFTLIGIIIGGICYLLLISMVINKRQENLYFIAYLISSCIIISYIHTDAYTVFSFYPDLFEMTFSFLISINAVIFITFYQRFFSTDELCGLGHKILKGFSLCYIGLFISTLFIGYQYFYTIFCITSGTLLLFFMRFSWVNWQKRIPYTLHFNLCFVTITVMSGLYLLNTLRLIPNNLLLSFGFAMANALLVLVFAINLSKRIIKVRDQQIQAASNAATAIAESDAKGDFLAKMSHEIRTPMNGVLGMVQLLKETPLTPIQNDYIQVIEQSGTTLVTVINDILDYSKVEAGKMTIESSSLSIEELIHNVQFTFAEQVRAKGLTLESNIHKNVPKAVLGDQNRITQILINLISNAIKFTESGSIKIEIQNLYKNTQQQNIIRFSITDTGIGIAKERLNKLFHAFEQADTSTTRIYGGTGLGLTICEQLIHLMKGEIGIHSEQGHGTSIWFDLPLEETLNINLDTQHNKSLSSDSNIVVFKNNIFEEKNIISPKPILVAEDNDVNQKVLLGMLKQLGFKADFVNDGLQALNMAKKHHDHYQLLLMDCEMPIMDGYTASDKIRSWEKEQHLSRLPIIAITAHALDDMREKSIAHGMDDHITKPIQLTTLSERIYQWVNTSQKN